MKKRFVIIAAALSISAVFLSAGCSSSGGSGSSGSGLDIGVSGIKELDIASDSPYVGTWIDEYEYFDETYRTTLVISANGTAAYYNEEAELGNFSATWKDNGDSITILRSDGSKMTAYISDGVLIEQDDTGAVSEYYKE